LLELAGQTETTKLVTAQGRCVQVAFVLLFLQQLIHSIPQLITLGLKKIPRKDTQYLKIHLVITERRNFITD